MTTVDSTPLPDHATMVAGDDVWLEGEAVAQFARVAATAGCVRAVALPDLHPGRGIPVGAAFAFRGAIHPALVGGDAGCGVRLWATTIEKLAADRLERRVGDALAEDPLAGCERHALLEAVWRHGARGLAAVEGVDGGLAELAGLEPDDPDGPAADGDDDELAAYRDEDHAAALGTIGGGNHFAEIARVDEVRDAAAAEALGLAPGRLVALAHSGSRGLGGALARRWGGQVLTLAADDETRIYRRELAGACRFARANRLVLTYRLLRALGAARQSKLAGTVEVTHNAVRLEEVAGAPAWVHRKGASPAPPGAATVVLGSRGAPSWVMIGSDDGGHLHSVAHGAGRRMGRSEARAKIKARYRRRDLARTELGGRVLCDDPDLLYEEHPDAYKPIEPIVASLVAAGVARPVASLIPVVTIKR